MYNTTLNNLFLNLGDPSEDVLDLPILQTENSGMSSATEVSIVSWHHECVGFHDIFAHCENSALVSNNYKHPKNNSQIIQTLMKWYIPAQCVLTRYRAVAENLQMDVHRYTDYFPVTSRIREIKKRMQGATNQMTISLNDMIVFIIAQAYKPDNSAMADVLTKMHSWLSPEAVKERIRRTIRQVPLGLKCLREDFIKKFPK